MSNMFTLDDIKFENISYNSKNSVVYDLANSIGENCDMWLNEMKNIAMDIEEYEDDDDDTTFEEMMDMKETLAWLKYQWDYAIRALNRAGFITDESLNKALESPFIKMIESQLQNGSFAKELESLISNF